MRRKYKGAITALGTTGGILLLVALYLFLSSGAVGMRKNCPGDTSIPLAGHVANPDPFSLRVTQDDVITCTLEITTTDKSPLDNHSFAQAASIANYTGQALVAGMRMMTTPQADYYRLDNANPQTQYTVQARPDWTTNYNLGIIVYNKDKVPIITDTNTFDNNYASVILVADDQGPYFFKVFQVSAQCSGHTYKLELSSSHQQ